MAGKRKSATESHASSPARKTRRTTEQSSDSRESASSAALSSNFKTLPINKVYRMIEPGPVLLVTTGSLADGTHNVMTVGFHMMMQHEAPPLIGVCIGPWDASYTVLKAHKECVLAVPAVEMAEVVVDVGNCSAADDGVDKWTRFGLPPLAASKVKAPLVGGQDVLANVECVVEDTRMVSKYHMWVLRPVKAWVNEDKVSKGGKMFHHRGDGTFVVDGERLNLQERMVKWKRFQD